MGSNTFALAGRDKHELLGKINRNGETVCGRNNLALIA